MNSLWKAVRSLSAGRKFRASCALVVGLAGTVIYGKAVGQPYPIHDWLFWIMAELWLWVGLFSIGCLSFGQFVLARVLRLRDLPALESTVLAMAVGTVAFVMAMYVGGALGSYNATFAVALPLAMLAVGAVDGFALVRRMSANAQDARYSTLSLAIAAFGLLGLGFVYLGVMTPEVINCDAMMIHLKIPEDYARAGRIVPFLANYHAAVPHLASILYTWGTLVPGLHQVQHWMLALHLEFCLFLWTLLGVSAAVRRLVGDYTLHAGWAAMFLFPGFFLADSNLAGSADHVLAFFAIPVALATLRTCSGFSMGDCALLAITIAGALLTKYQAVYLIAPVGVILAGAWLVAWYRLIRVKRNLRPIRARHLWWAPLILFGVGAVLVSPHFIKNEIFYHNPVYPFMRRTFTAGAPTFPGAGLYIDNLYTDRTWIPEGSFLARFKHAVELFFTFSLQPHYFPRAIPYFGSLFTLLLPGLLFVPGRRATLMFAAIGTGAIILWGMLFNVDRNLQTFTPILVCVTAAIIVKTWRLGAIARAGLIPLVALQVIWGADTCFYDAGRGRIYGAMDLIASGVEGRASQRLNGYRSTYLALTKALPTNARVLLHSAHDSLGIDRDLRLDRPGFQGLISYQGVRSPRELFEYYRSLGITHVIQDEWEPNPAAQRDELLFRTLTIRYSMSRGTFGHYHLFELPQQAPPTEHPYRVLSLGVSGYADGLYPIDSMGVVEYLPPPLRRYSQPEESTPPGGLPSLLDKADAVLRRGDVGTDGDFARLLSFNFDAATTWGGGLTLFLRRH